MWGGKGNCLHVVSLVRAGKGEIIEVYVASTGLSSVSLSAADAEGVFVTQQERVVIILPPPSPPVSIVAAWSVSRDKCTTEDGGECYIFYGPPVPGLDLLDTARPLNKQILIIFSNMIGH